MFSTHDDLTRLTEGEGARVFVCVSQDRVLGAAPQRLAVPQLGAVQHQGQAVSQRPLVELLTAHPLVHPGQVGAGIRPQPGAVEVEVLRVCRWAPHTQWVSVWNICLRATEVWQSMTVITVIFLMAKNRSKIKQCIFMKARLLTCYEWEKGTNY